VVAALERSVEIMRLVATLLVTPLLFASCGVDKRCDHVCTALRSVRPDSEGYLPRDKVFGSVGITEADLSPFATLSGGSCVLDCGCWFEYTERGSLSDILTKKTIDEILNNPNRTARAPQSQLMSAVLIDRHSRELCRVESPALRRWRAAAEKE
jgi:hypothetical protein